MTTFDAISGLTVIPAVQRITRNARETTCKYFCRLLFRSVFKILLSEVGNQHAIVSSVQAKEVRAAPPNVKRRPVDSAYVWMAIACGASPV